MEVKTYWNNDTGKDVEKLRGFTDPKEGYHYKFGASLIIGKETAKLDLFS